MRLTKCFIRLHDPINAETFSLLRNLTFRISFFLGKLVKLLAIRFTIQASAMVYSVFFLTFHRRCISHITCLANIQFFLCLSPSLAHFTVKLWIQVAVEWKKKARKVQTRTKPCFTLFIFICFLFFAVVFVGGFLLYFLSLLFYIMSFSCFSFH